MGGATVGRTDLDRDDFATTAEAQATLDADLSDGRCPEEYLIGRGRSGYRPR